jgi:uncharacterized protein
MRSVFVGPQGVRAGWRFAAFFAMVFAGNVLIIETAGALGWLKSTAFWDPPHFLLGEISLLVPILIATSIMARFEKRTFSSYGLRRRDAGRLWEGVLWGAATITGLMLVIWALHGYMPGGLNVHGLQLVQYLIVWLGLFALVGISEEMGFRGYPLFALSRGMGFWPAAIVLALLFGAAHLNKPGETPSDITNIVLIGLFLSYTIYATGSLWLAIGFHAAFDFFALFVYSAPNAGEVLPGRLLQASFHGPAWLTGGPLGPEASLFMVPIIVLLFAAFRMAHRERRFDVAAVGDTRA